jgi:hypothetical protein
LWFETSLGKKLPRLYFKNKAGTPATWEGEDKRIKVLNPAPRPYLKNKRTEGIPQVEEYLSSRP